MTAPSLAQALDAYCHAIACGADSLTRAERLADLTGAARADIDREYQIEQMIADPEGQRLVAAIHAGRHKHEPPADHRRPRRSRTVHRRR